MATYYVYSGAGGANNGTSWTDAWTAAASVPSLSDGDLVLVASDHISVATGALNFGGTNALTGLGARIISTNRSTGLYQAGANFNSYTQLWFYAGRVVHGIQTAQLGMWPTTNVVWARGCTVQQMRADNTSGEHIFEDGTISRASLGTPFSSPGGRITVRRSTLVSVSTSAAFGLGSHKQFFELEDCDMTSSFVTLFAAAPTNSVEVIFRRCRLAAGFSPTTIGRQTIFVMEACEEGSISAPVLRTERHDWSGNAKTDTTKYRSGGADIAGTEFSVALTATASRTVKGTYGARSLPLRRWVNGGSSVTFTAYLAHNAVGAGGSGALQDDECWLELSGPPTSGNGAKGYGFSSRLAYGNTASDLASDASSWTGSSIGTKQKLTHSYTPAVGGVIEARIVFAPGSGSNQTIYLDAALATS